MFHFANVGCAGKKSPSIVAGARTASPRERNRPAHARVCVKEVEVHRVSTADWTTLVTCRAEKTQSKRMPARRSANRYSPPAG